LRSCSHNQKCFDELMEIREHVLEYLKTLKEVTHHTNPDESDDLETAKLIESKNILKDWSQEMKDKSTTMFLT